MDGLIVCIYECTYANYASKTKENVKGWKLHDWQQLLYIPNLCKFITLNFGKTLIASL